MAREALREVVGSGEFFVATLPNGLRMVHAITRGERHPLNFGREVYPLASCYELLQVQAAFLTLDGWRRCLRAWQACLTVWTGRAV